MYWLRVVLFLLSLVLQTSVLPHVLPAGIVPDLLLVFAVLIGLHAGPREGLWWGGLAGLFTDLLSGRFIGFHIAAKAGAAYCAGIVGLKVYRHNPGVPAVLAGVATLVQELLRFGVLRLYGLELYLMPALSGSILPHALVNLGLAALLSPLVYRLFVHQKAAAEG